jgi:hypothetical protein
MYGGSVFGQKYGRRKYVRANPASSDTTTRIDIVM